MASKMNKKQLYEAYKKLKHDTTKEIGLLSLEVSNLQEELKNSVDLQGYEGYQIEYGKLLPVAQKLKKENQELKDKLELLTVDYDDAIADLGNEKRHYKELTDGLNKIIAKARAEQ